MQMITNADNAGGIRFIQMTQEEQDAGVEYATANTMAIDYGDLSQSRGPNRVWRRYILLPTENRTPEDVAGFKAAIGWVDPA